MLNAVRQPVVSLLDHRFTIKNASAAVDGELSPAQEERIRRHASICPQCHELLAGLRRTISTLAELRSRSGQPVPDGSPAAPSVVASILTVVREATNDAASNRPRRPPGGPAP